MTAKEFLNSHIENGEFALLNKGHVEIILQDFAKLTAIEIIKKLSKTENEYQYNIKYVFPEYNIK